jgi:hypothetical protein
MPQVRVAFDRIEKFFGALGDADRARPETRAAADALARDGATRASYFSIMRATQDPALRVRMIALARSVGWLAPDEHRAELVHTINDVLAGDTMAFGEVDLVCTLNRDRALDTSLNRLQVEQSNARIAQAAALACLGSADARARILKAVREPERRRRADSAGISPATGRSPTPLSCARSRAGSCASRASRRRCARWRPWQGLHVTTARCWTSWRAFSANRPRSRCSAPSPKSSSAQATRQPRIPSLAAVFRQHRIKSPSGEDLIDVLIRRLQS